MIKAIKELTAQKLLIYFLSIAISILWYKLENVEVKGYGRNDRLQARFDSIQDLRIKEKQICADAVSAKDLEMKDLLRAMWKEQKEVKSEVQGLGKSADKVFHRAKTKLTIQQP